MMTCNICGGAEARRDKQDAERYRWLRSRNERDDVVVCGLIDYQHTYETVLVGDDLDNYIDAALKEKTT